MCRTYGAGRLHILQTQPARKRRAGLTCDAPTVLGHGAGSPAKPSKAQTGRPRDSSRGLPRRSALTAREEARVVEDSGDGFGVADFAALDPAFRGSEREQARRDFFVRFGVRLALLQAAGEEDDHALGEEARGREDFEHFCPTARGVAGFLFQFAPGALREAFVFLFVARDKLPEILAGYIAELTDDQDAAVRKHGQHDDRAWVRDHLSHCVDSARLNDAI